MKALRSLFVPVCLLAAGACSSSTPDIPPEYLQAGGTELVETQHKGPPVADIPSGPARVVSALDGAFESRRAMETVSFTDGYYRAPAGDGYNAVLDYIAAELRAAGYGSDERLELVEFETTLTAPSLGARSRVPSQAWTPLRGSIALHVDGGEPETLHAFDAPDGRDRVMLPINCPSANVSGQIVQRLEDIEPGKILVIDAPPRRSVLTRAQAQQAAAVVSASLQSFNVDPTGQDRHLDAIQFRTVPVGLEIPVIQISPRSMVAIREGLAADPNAALSIDVLVEWDERPLRTLVATIVGQDRPDEAVVTVSHVQEPGAGDNATGVAGLLESARSLAVLLRDDGVEWPSRSLVFIWGDEFRQSEAWLQYSARRAVAALSSDMTGQSSELTGAIALLEREPDPGAVTPLPPDEHTPWGAGEVDGDALNPNGLAVIARCAMADVAALSGGEWITAEHPWEGGSDHDEFIERGIPAALFWHFTDFAYHTSLDRLEHVDPVEMKRTAVALMATAYCLADPRPEDLDRYLRTNNLEQIVRVEAAEAENNLELAEAWREWCRGAREWLRIECLGIPQPR